MSAQLQVILGPDRGRSFPLSPGATLQIGRSQTTDTQLTDATVSRNHCDVTFDGTSAVLVNRSARGTQLNGLPIEREELHHGDVIRIGTTEIRYSLATLGEAETLLQPAPS